MSILISVSIRNPKNSFKKGRRRKGGRFYLIGSKSHFCLFFHFHRSFYYFFYIFFSIFLAQIFFCFCLLFKKYIKFLFFVEMRVSNKYTEKERKWDFWKLSFFYLVFCLKNNVKNSGKSSDKVRLNAQALPVSVDIKKVQSKVTKGRKILNIFFSNLEIILYADILIAFQFIL